MSESVLPSPHAEAAREQARAAARAALAKRAGDVLVLDLRELTSVCDFFVVCTAESEPQLKAIVENVESELKKLDVRPWHVEGLTNRRWVVLDYVDFVVHVFHKSARETYLLERLWGDAPREVFDAGE